MTAPHEMEDNRPVWKKIAWFIALWAGGVLALATFGYGIKFLIPV